jgi:NUDIX domain/Ion channel
MRPPKASKLLLETIPDAIHFQTPLAPGVATGEPSRLIYFSFETLTTVSYGDAYPVHRLARSLATAEALIGQLYPAILIATLVGMAVQARSDAALKETKAKSRIEHGSEEPKAMTSSFINNNMLIDPSMQKDIIRRAIDGNFGDNPNQAVHSLGTVKTPDGQEVPVHLRHAADAVVMDALGHVVLITRKHNPGAGLKALPGGFMDAVLGVGGATVAENAVAAALREVTEETGISKLLLEEAHIIPVGHRSYNRPFDIRVAWGDIPGTDIKKGDFFAVSTQAFCMKTTQDRCRSFTRSLWRCSETITRSMANGLHLC